MKPITIKADLVWDQCLEIKEWEMEDIDSL